MHSQGPILSPRNTIFCVSSALGREEDPRLVARSASKSGVGYVVCVLGVSFAVVSPRWLRGKRLVLPGCSLPLRTDWPPSPRQHASLLRPDWPRPALNSGRLISFTKVKGARLGGVGGAPRQAAALFRSALIGALDLASDVNPQTKCPLRMKMHEAAQRVETNFTARGRLGPTPQALPAPCTERRLTKPGSDLGKDASPWASGISGKGK